MSAPSIDHHQVMDVMSAIVLFFGIAGVVVPLLQRLRLSPVLGYLLCGIAIGPYGLSVFAEAYPWLGPITIQDTNTVNLLGELGIISLMFMIGLELSLDRLKELKRYIFGLGSAQILVCAVVIFGIASLFDNSLQAAIVLGAAFALSSTAIVMKLLQERRLSNTPIGILCFSILLMQDLAVVPILVLASSFSGQGEESVLVTLATSLVLGTVTIVAMYWLGKKGLRPLLRSVSHSTNPEWLAAFVVFVAIGFAALTYATGLSLALGAFMAGLLISETEFKHEVEVIIEPLKGLLLGIFFLSIGMMINLLEVMDNPVLLPLSVVGIYLIKAAIIFPLCLLFRVPSRQAGEAAVYLAEPGEFALMILGVAMATGLMPTDHVQFFLLVTVVAMMLTPGLFKLAPHVGRISHQLFEGRADIQTPETSAAHTTVVIAGFGRVGQLVGRALEKQGVPYTALDMDAERVRTLKRQGFPIIYADARKPDLWRRLVSTDIEAVVIAIDDHTVAPHILNTLKAQSPLLPVIMRAEDLAGLHALYDAGASHVVAETLESSLRIAELLMETLGKSPEEVRHLSPHLEVQNTKT